MLARVGALDRQLVPVQLPPVELVSILVWTVPLMGELLPLVVLGAELLTIGLLPALLLVEPLLANALLPVSVYKNLLLSAKLRQPLPFLFDLLALHLQFQLLQLGLLLVLTQHLHGLRLEHFQLPLLLLCRLGIRVLQGVPGLGMERRASGSRENRDGEEAGGYGSECCSVHLPVPRRFSRSRT